MYNVFMLNITNNFYFILFFILCKKTKLVLQYALLPLYWIQQIISLTQFKTLVYK